MTVVIDSKGLEYRILKHPDLTYEIEISLPIQGGLSIYHMLLEQEEKEYLNKGIVALQDRINDMKEKYSTYRVVSWR